MSISPYWKQQWTNSVTHMWILWHHKQVSRAWKSNCTVTVLRHVFMNVASMTQQIDTCHIHDISIYKIPQECGKSIDNMTCMSHLSLAQSYLRRYCSLKVVKATCVLHNFVIDTNEQPLDIPGEEEDMRPLYDGGFVDATYVNRRGRVAQRKPEWVFREKLTRFLASDAGEVEWQWNKVDFWLS